MSDHAERAEQHWDSSSDPRFVEYYANQSASDEAFERARGYRDTILRVRRRFDSASGRLDVADIGCNAGTMCMAWAEQGHVTSGIDINQPLLDVARERARQAGYDIDYRLGTATELPWPSGSQDVCIALELLEHVEDWRGCIAEFARVLRVRGVMCLTTTNVLCPRQNEFRLPLYSWYPGPVKRHVVHLAKTSRPGLANFATYPAVNWFSYYRLRAVLEPMGFDCMDRFDVMDVSSRGPAVQLVASSIRRLSLMRFLAHTMVDGTVVFAVKR